MEDWLWASQFIQSQALKTAIQSHRLAAPHCMGTLFWQLNDCWPGASWSVIDYYGNEKIAYEEIQQQFSPIIAIADTANGKFSITIQSEIPAEGILYVQHYLISGDAPKRIEIKFKVEAFKPQVVLSFRLKKFIQKGLLNLDFIYYKLGQDEFYFEDHFLFRKLSRQ